MNRIKEIIEDGDVDKTTTENSVRKFYFEGDWRYAIS